MLLGTGIACGVLCAASAWALLSRQRAARHDAGSARDAERFRASAAQERERAAEQARRSTAHLSAIVAAQQEIAAAHQDLDTALPRLLERAQSVTGAEGAAVGRLRGDEIVYEVATGSAAPHAPFRTRRDASLSGAALRAGALLRCDDAELDPRVDRELLRRMGVRSAVALPLLFDGVTVGVLLVGARRVAGFDEDATQALHLFGGMLATAMSHARELEVRQRTIAERTAALAALRDREEQYRMVTDGVPLLIAYVDAEERCRFVNRACELTFGLTSQQIIGRRVADLLGEAYPRARPWIERTLRGERVTCSTLLALPAGGRQRMSVTLEPRMGEGGMVMGYLVMATDLSEHDRLEEQFRQAQKMEAVGKLAGGVAHDFNNILCVITSISHLMLEDGGLSDDQRADVAEVRRAAERATDLTRKLLAFSRRQTLQPRVLDLNAIVLDAEKMLRRLIREDVQLVPRLGASIGRVHADPAQLEQVLLNLVVNARDSMPAGGRITVETADETLDAELVRRHPGATAGRHVRLTVADAGHGMAPEVLARAFEPFFTTKEQGKGSGLGLAIVYGIVEQSGGFVEVDTSPGCGTAVTVWLPRVDGGVEPSPRPELRSTALGGDETVLLVEDEHDVRIVAQRVLEERGYRVLCASNGIEALAAVGPEVIDLLVTDVVMPEMGGCELAAVLTRLRPGLPVLFTSGYAADELGEDGVLAREVAFVQKPFTPDGLSRAVREALDARGGGCPASPAPAATGQATPVPASPR